jgi:phospholipase C
MIASLLLSSSSFALESSSTNTPIKHLVVIFQENVSYDHYFATYPNAENPSGEHQILSEHKHESDLETNDQKIKCEDLGCLCTCHVQSTILFN